MYTLIQIYLCAEKQNIYEYVDYIEFDRGVQRGVDNGKYHPVALPSLKNFSQRHLWEKYGKRVDTKWGNGHEKEKKTNIFFFFDLGFSS
jgi:hypothetical protein